MTATAKASRTPAARQRAGRPPAQPATQPAQATVTSLGDPSAGAQLARLQAQIDSLRAAQAAAPHPALPAGRPEDPDILGIPGLKPLRLSTTDVEPLSTGRHPLFYIDDREYTVPDEVPQSVALEFVHLAATGDVGLLTAQDYLLTELLSDEAYAALRAYKYLTAAQLAWIIQTCVRIALGALETPKG